MALSLIGRGGAGVGSLGGIATNWSGTFGGVPAVPNPSATQGAALSGNIANLGQIYGLTGGLNASLAGQQRGQIAAGLPDYSSMVGQSSANIQANLQGRLPTDVVNNILRTAAEKGILTGTSGAPISDTQLLYTLGRDSLQQSMLGEQQLTGAIARTPQPQLVRPESFLVSPEQMQEAQYAANVMRAAPIPALAGSAGRGAAMAGYNQGVGAISAPRMNPFAPQGGYNPFEPQGADFGGPPEVALSANPVAAAPVPDFATSWANWAASLPQNPAAGAQGYQLGNPAQPNLFPQEEDYYNV